jgi:simple sugar transport system substrate-binding protein
MRRRRLMLAASAMIVAVGLPLGLVATAGGSARPERVMSVVPTQAATLPGGKDISRKTILFNIYTDPANMFWVPTLNGIKAAVKAAGVKVQMVYSNQSDATQINQIKTAIAKKVAGIAVSIPTTALNKVLCDARAKGIPVVAFNINATSGAARKCVMAFVGQDFVTTGNLIAGHMIDLGLIKRGAHVFCPVEIPAAAYAAGRAAGANKALKRVGAHCDVVGTGSDLAPAKATMVNYLLGHRNTSAIIALGGTPLAVAPATIEQVNRKIPIGGFDLSQPVIQGIKNGTITATVDQQPYSQGFYPVMQLALYLKYALFPSDMNTGGLGLVDKSNIATVEALAGTYR